MLVPVGIDHHGDRRLGNQVSALLVRLPVGVRDPVQRLSAVSDAVARCKTHHQALAGELLIDLLDPLPQPALAAAARLVQHQPFVNLVVTNVPGPAGQLYAMGARMLEVFPVVPLAGNLSVGIAAFSYGNQLSVGILADRDGCADIDVLASGIRRGFSAIVAAATATATATAPGARPRPARRVSAARRNMRLRRSATCAFGRGATCAHGRGATCAHGRGATCGSSRCADTGHTSPCGRGRSACRRRHRRRQGGRGVVIELVYPRLLLPRVEQFADKVGFVDVTGEGVQFEGTFATHIDRVRRLAHALAGQLGVARQDRFAVLAMNGHEFLELYHAALFGAGVITPLNIRFSGAELAYVLADSDTRVVFTDPVFAPLLDRARDEGAKIDTIVVIGGVPGDGVTDRGATIGYEELIAAAEPVSGRDPEEDDPVILMYTGGTTGLPKGALLDQRAEILNLYHVGMQIGLPASRRFLFQAPMFHAAVVAGVLGIPASGATSVSIPLFDPGLVLSTIDDQRIDTTMMVPVMLGMLEQHPQFSARRLRSLRQLVYGAAPISATMLTRWLELLPDTEFHQGYGMTEAASVLAFLGPDEHRRGGMLGAAGTPVYGVELRITDSLGHPCATGTPGEVCARGGNMMRGYWGKPEETEAAMRDGWYRTGDVGFLDEHGMLHLTDRVKDMIVTGGENVYSTEVENVLAMHPAVKDVAVIGIPSDAWGEAVHAIVVLKEDMRGLGGGADRARQEDAHVVQGAQVRGDP